MSNDNASERALEREASRFDALVGRGFRLLTVMSIVSVTYALLLSTLLTHYDAVSGADAAFSVTIAENILFMVYVFIIVLSLVGAFVTTLVAVLLLNPRPSVAVQASCEAYRGVNEKIRKLLKASMILLTVSVGVAAIGGLVIMFFI